MSTFYVQTVKGKRTQDTLQAVDVEELSQRIFELQQRALQEEPGSEVRKKFKAEAQTWEERKALATTMMKQRQLRNSQLQEGEQKPRRAKGVFVEPQEGLLVALLQPLSKTLLTGTQ